MTFLPGSLPCGLSVPLVNRYQCHDTLTAVTAASEACIGLFNERDVPSMIWSLASLKVKKLPPRLMAQLVALSVDKIVDMSPQVSDSDSSIFYTTAYWIGAVLPPISSHCCNAPLRVAFVICE